MNGFLLCIFPLFTLLNVVLAITCYTCTPDPPTMSCLALGDLNVTDCDADPTIPQGMADTCTRTIQVVKIGEGAQMKLNAFSCMMKAYCQVFQANACNASQLSPGMTYEKCEATCCEHNKCNGLEDSNSASPSSPATSVPAQPTDVSPTGTPAKPTSGATAYNKVVSFATIFTSVLCFVY